MPEPGPGEVLVEVRGAGLCHSDLDIMDWPAGTMPWQLPFTLGHETAGTVAALGAGAEGVAVGDPVLVFAVWGCGSCRQLRRGRRQPLHPPLGAPGERHRRRRRARRVPARPLAAIPRADRRPGPGDGGAAVGRGPHALPRAQAAPAASPRLDGRRDRRRRPRTHRDPAPAGAHAGARGRARPARSRARARAHGGRARRARHARARRRRAARGDRSGRSGARARLRRRRRDAAARRGRRSRWAGT